MIRAKWIRFINGSSIAFKELYDLYIDELFSYGISIHGNKDLVMDCIHDLFIDLFDNPRIAQDVNVKYYLLASLKRRIIKRKQETRQVGSLQELPESENISEELQVIENPESDIIQIENQLQLERIINFFYDQLPPRQREVLNLRFYKGFSYDDISNMMGVSVSTCRTLCYRGLKLLRENLKSFGAFLILFFFI